MSGYHAFTFGFLIGEFIRRTTGLSLGAFLREEVTTKIDADFHLGLAEPEFGRLAQSQQAGVRAMDEGSFLYRATGVLMANEPDPGKIWESPAMRMAEVSGYGNARSLVTVCSVLANGSSTGA